MSTMQVRPDAPILRAPGQGDTRPPPTFGEAAEANLNLLKDDREDYQALYLFEGYDDLENELVRMGHKRTQYRNLPGSHHWYGEDNNPRQDALWGDVEAERRRNPAAFPDLPKTKPEFETWLAARKGGRQRDQQTSAAGPTGSAIVPGLGFGLLTMAEPQNLLMLPMGGGGRTVAGTLAKNFLAGSSFSVLTAPERVAQRGKMGEGYSGDELLRDAAMGGVTQAGFVGLHLGAAKGGKLAYDQLPLDYRLAQQLKAEVPSYLRSPEQQAAIHVIERGAEIDGSSPYHPTAQALDRHAQRLQATMDAIDDAPPAALAAAARPAAAVAKPGAPRGPAKGQIGFDNSVYQGLRERGIPEHTARGVAAGIHAESASDPTVRGGYKGRAVGYGQWLGTRREELIRRYGPNPTAAQQLDFMAWELKGGDLGGAKVLAAGDEVGAMTSYINDFMRPAKGAETSGDLQRGMAALGRGGEDMPGGAAAASEPMPFPDRPAAMDAVRPEVMAAAMPEVLRPLIADRARSLNDVGALARDLGVSEDMARGGLDELVLGGHLLRTRSGLYRRPARPGNAGPEDMLRYLARRGGLSPDGFSEPQRIRNLNMNNPPRAHDLTNTGNFKHFVPGAGPLLRQRGMGLDQAGELLHDAGYFGPPEITPRPTEAELITLINDVIGRKEKHYSFFEQGEQGKDSVKRLAEASAPAKAGWQNEAHYEEQRARWAEAGQRVLRRDLSESEFETALAQLQREPLDPAFNQHDGSGYDQGADLDPYVQRMAQRKIDAALEDAFVELEDPAYDFLHDGAAIAAGEADGAGASGQGQALDPGNPRAGEGGAEAGAGAEAGLSPAQRDAAEAAGALGEPIDNPQAEKLFSDPDGDGMRLASESIWHDLRAGEADPKLAAVADRPKVDLDDGAGPRTMAEHDAALAQHEQGLAAIRSCMS